MRQVFGYARNAGSKGEYPIAALIYNPQTATNLALAHDTRTSTSHPLHHAVMNCIDLVAARERANIGRDAGSCEACIPAKRKSEEDELSLVGAETNQKEVNAASRPAYLCTGYDLYVSHEPCVMCSMALVHSRITRVFYCRPSRSCGGLGSVYYIHSQHNLNHHFKVFRGVLQEEASSLCDVGETDI